MKPYAKKLLLTTAVAVGLFSSTIQFAKADPDADVGVSAVTRNAIVVTKDTDMDFGQLDVIIADQEGDVVLTTGGTIDVTDTANTVTASGGTPTAGQVTINTDATSDIEVTCTVGTMENAGGDILDITALTIEGDTTSSAVAANTDCTTAPAVVSPLLEDVVLQVGATINLDGANKVVTGNQTYSTTVGGTAPNVAAAYQ